MLNIKFAEENKIEFCLHFVVRQESEFKKCCELNHLHYLLQL